MPGCRSARRLDLHHVVFVVARPLATTLEGGDVQLIPHRRLALLGHGVRSHLGLARFLRARSPRSFLLAL